MAAVYFPADYLFIYLFYFTFRKDPKKFPPAHSTQTLLFLCLSATRGTRTAPLQKPSNRSKHSWQFASAAAATTELSPFHTRFAPLAAKCQRWQMTQCRHHPGPDPSCSRIWCLLTVFHAINSPDNSVLPVLFLPDWSFQLRIY